MHELEPLGVRCSALNALNSNLMTRCLSFLVLVALAISLQAQQITITNPVAGAQVPVGRQCAIAWTSQGLAPGTQLKIGIKVDGAGDQPVAAFVPVEAGLYQWLIPWACPTGSTCRVEIGLQNAESSSQGTATFRASRGTLRRKQFRGATHQRRRAFRHRHQFAVQRHPTGSPTPEMDHALLLRCRRFHAGGGSD